MLVGAVLLHKLLEPRPWNLLQQLMQDAIVMPHGVVLFGVQNVAKRLETRRIKAMHPVHKNKPDSSGVLSV